MSEYSFHLDKGINESRSYSFVSALQSFSKAIQFNGNSKAAYLNHGALCNQSGLFDVAIEDFNAVIDLDPWDIPAYFNRFLSYFAKVDYKQALKDLYIAVSLALTKQGEITNKIDSFDNALKLVSNNVKALLGRAKQRRALGTYPSALNDINEAIRLCPNFKEAYAERAALHRRLKNNTECQEDINKVLELSKNSNTCVIDLSPTPVFREDELVQSELREKYRIFMELRGIIYSKNDRNTRHLKVLANFSEVHRQTERQYSEITHQNNVSYSNLSKVESTLNKLKKNVDDDKQILNRSLNNSRNDSLGKKSRSESGSSAERKKFVFTSGKNKNKGNNILDEVDFEDTNKNKVDETDKKKVNMTSKQQTKLVTNLIQSSQEETRSVNNEKTTDSSTKKRGSIGKAANTGKIKTQANQTFESVQIEVHKANLLKNTELIGGMTPYCLVKYGRESNKTETDKGSNPTWNQKFTFKYKSSRGLFTLTVFDKETLKNDDYIGEAIISIVDGSNEAELKNNNTVVGTIQYDVRLV